MKREKGKEKGKDVCLPIVVIIDLLFLLFVLFHLELLHLLVESVHDDLFGDLNVLGPARLIGKVVLGGTLDLRCRRETVHGLGSEINQNGVLDGAAEPL